MHPAHDHFRAAAAVEVGDFIAPLHRGGHRGDAYQVGFQVGGQRLDLFVNDRHLPIRRRQRSDLEQAQAGHAEEKAAPHQTSL